ncbi:hypothetical protein [Vibrio cionasavignyae]|uniref:hypothetical protein n=1 Tax=Vibrio cionasavignyae TaxID=2910252 RepID=UPI003D0BCD8B
MPLNKLSLNKLILSTLLSTVGLASFGFLVGCQPQMMREPLPEKFGLDNVDILVNQKILLPEKLDTSGKGHQFKVGVADLNRDDRDEIMVLMQSPYFCGSGGCTAYLFNDKGELLNRMTVVKEPVLISERHSKGWKDFYVWSDGSLRIMSFDGVTYPQNPSLQPKYDRQLEEKAAFQLAEIQEIYVQDGYDLLQVTDVPLLYSVHSYQFQFKHYGDVNNQYRITIDMITGSLALESSDTSNKSGDIKGSLSQN